ncbi:ABC transporter substrate-binding protein [Pseudonocardia sp. KRD-184]|uniref:ABC transporter substrate-binding protein n=1 Tax=Pseudonocardia oceani TaxID=2792013 RepID=A0ABS6U9Y6_9PSEU|nr:hypothetical protein [Pseudonocardia oceani]MBW0089656.1 ABC transporter substrate-binding protein [Pseudonocardia oceani]MBW0094786.1 ABC transporter substrate-binding protein [Pseudonocardia oceani]MBW0110763.1 ABC transporter substrate-binding protein [Pseudonocardia oceani]MBW0123547.1 ABC transporter substrate-binding protein [Pseudonocardia oceani]MBW0129018.1 ABC transporter substrate-binding protein [Pseudonocardia oceani]
MSSTSENPREQPVRTAALTAIIGAAGGRRAFVDATGTPVTLPPLVRRLVATDEVVGALLRELGAELVGCAGSLDGVETVGADRAPDPRAVAALEPHVIVAGAVDRVHDLADERLVGFLRKVAPVIAVDTGRPAVARADLRALLGTGRAARSAPAPIPDRPPGPPQTRPRLW